jgi:hypothetical protein
MGWPWAHHELPASRCFEPIGQAPADPGLRARPGPNDWRLELLSLRERGWGEGRAKRSLRTSQSIPSPSPLFCRLRRRARAFGQPIDRPNPTAVIGWALAHHELHARLGVFCLLRRSKRRAELSVRPSAGPTYLSLRGQRKVGQRKATPRPRPSRIRARRVRVSPWVFVDRPSLACHEHRPHPCGRPCGLIHALPPLPRGPV